MVRAVPDNENKQEAAAGGEEAATDDKAEAEADGDAKPEGSDWRAQLESHLADAKEIGKDIRGRLANAGKRASDEAKETWSKLEPQLENAEKHLREATDDAVESLKGMFGELKGSLSKLRDKV